MRWQKTPNDRCWNKKQKSDHFGNQCIFENVKQFLLKTATF